MDQDEISSPELFDDSSDSGLDTSPYLGSSRIGKRKASGGDFASKLLKKNKHCRASKAKWTAEEDEILTKSVMLNGESNWKKIAQCLNDRSHLQCLHRWQKVLNPALVKGPWKEEEDLKLVELVEKYGPKDWSTIASHIKGRIGKQCRERWFNHLSPDVRKTNWAPEEDQIIIDAHQRLGNKWTAISKLLDGRPANAIKNHWNSTLLKRIQEKNGNTVEPRPRNRTKKRDLSPRADQKLDDQDSNSPPTTPKAQTVPQLNRSSPSIPLPTQSQSHLHIQSSQPMFQHAPSIARYHTVVSGGCIPNGLNLERQELHTGMNVGMGNGLYFAGAPDMFSWDYNAPLGTMPVPSAAFSHEFGLGLTDSSPVPDFMEMHHGSLSSSSSSMAHPLPELQFCFDVSSPVMAQELSCSSVSLAEANSMLNLDFQFYPLPLDPV